MNRAITCFLNFVYRLAWVLLYGTGMVLIAILGCLLIALFFPAAPTTFSGVIVMGFISILAFIFLGLLDGIRHRVALRRYLDALPRMDASAFRLAYPEYEEEFLFEVRNLIAVHFRIEPDKILPGIDLGWASHSLYAELFKRFRPPATPALEQLSLRTGALDPRPAHVLDFPAGETDTLGDLLREIELLRKWDGMSGSSYTREA